MRRARDYPPYHSAVEIAALVNRPRLSHAGRMLRLGQKHYDYVRSQSGFFVTLGEPQDTRGNQAWQLDLHFVPADTNPEPRPAWQLEYLELCFQPFGFHTADWRELDNFGPTEPLDPVLFNITLGNLLDGGYSCPRRSVFPEECSVKYLGGYLFRVRFAGAVIGDGEDVDLELEEEAAFVQFTTDAPVNAADPVAVAQAIAKREIKLTGFTGNHITRNDWRREQKAAGPIEFAHRVTLLTPWRESLA